MSGADDRAKSTASPAKVISGAAAAHRIAHQPDGGGSQSAGAAPGDQREVDAHRVAAPVRSALFMLDAGLRGNDLGPPTTTAWNVILPEPPLALIVAGPTASGKSALALELAERLRGTIINADAMQVYRELRVLTARPTPEDEARVPHALYGVRPAAEPGSVAWWREAALAEMDRARGGGRLPILTGGSGLYFASLTEGLADIPDPGPAARERSARAC